MTGYCKDCGNQICECDNIKNCELISKLLAPPTETEIEVVARAIDKEAWGFDSDLDNGRAKDFVMKISKAAISAFLKGRGT